MNVDLQLRQVFLATGGLPADLAEQGLVDAEPGEHRAFARRNEIDVCGLVPDDVLRAEVFHKHQHEERIDHRIQTATELGADVVAVVPAKAHRYLNVAEVIADVPNSYTGAKIRRVERHQPAHQSRLAEFSGQPLKHPDAFPNPWPDAQTSVWPVAADRDRANRCCDPATPMAACCRTAA
jgi:hypothetical protein